MFNQTQKMSTYLFCFVAGDFIYVEKEVNDLNIPIKIYYDKD